VDDDTASLDVCFDLQAASYGLVVVGILRDFNPTRFDVGFDFHTLFFSLWLLMLNIEQRHLGFKAAAQLYRRQREGKSITRRKYFCACKKAGRKKPAFVFEPT
jgi:hypothetical protein